MRQGPRVAAAICAPVGLGVVGGLFWQSQIDGFFAIGNWSAPYLAVPFVSSALTTREGRGYLRGAVVGAVSVLASLVAFYLVTTWGHTFASSTATMGLQKYAPPGLVVGAVAGALGSRYTTSSGAWWGVLLALPFFLEEEAWWHQVTPRSSPLVPRSDTSRGPRRASVTLETRPVRLLPPTRLGLGRRTPAGGRRRRRLLAARGARPASSPTSPARPRSRARHLSGPRAAQAAASGPRPRTVSE